MKIDIKRRWIVGALSAVAVAASALLASSGAEAAWPERPVTIIVPAGAGGGTDATARLLAKQLQDELRQPFNVVNQPQASGLVGHTNILQARPDGYTLGIIYPYYQLNLSGQSQLDHRSFAPIALYNMDPAALSVAANSQFRTAREALDFIRANPGRVRMSCGGSCGGSWDLPLAGLLVRLGIDPRTIVMVPSGGAAPGLQELVSGGVEMIACSLPEAAALISANRVRPLVVLASERAGNFPDVPTAREATGEDHTGGAWRAVAGPPGLPAEVVEIMERTLERIWRSDEFQNAMRQRGFGLRWANSRDTAAFLLQHEREWTDGMTALGMVRRAPR